jgi:hypothetical protein
MTGPIRKLNAVDGIFRKDELAKKVTGVMQG